MTPSGIGGTEPVLLVQDESIYQRPSARACETACLLNSRRYDHRIWMHNKKQQDEAQIKQVPIPQAVTADMDDASVRRDVTK